MAIAYYDSIVGLIQIEEYYGKIIRLEIVDYRIHKEELNPILENVISQLEEYFMGKRKEFDVEVEMFGTPYMLKVWEELKKISYGTTISYQELARRVGNIKGARSAGGACGKNNVMIIIPCHRVIGKNGKLVGFGGGLGVKQKLLELEYRNSN